MNIFGFLKWKNKNEVVFDPYNDYKIEKLNIDNIVRILNIDCEKGIESKYIIGFDPFEVKQ